MSTSAVPVWAPDETLAVVRSRVVKPEWAERVVSPAYDGVSAGWRRELMDRDPYVFLHVTRSADDVDPPLPPEELVQGNAAALRRLLDAGVFGPVEGPGLWLYRLRTADHEQIAVVGDLPLAAFDAGRLLPHERVRPQRATVLARHLAVVRAGSSPVATTYLADPAVDALVASASEVTTPVLDFRREDQLHQTIWRVPDDLVDELVARLSVKPQYIVDGHHRVAAGLEYRRQRGGEPGPHHAVLGAVFPHDQLRVTPFHRRVTDSNGLTLTEVLDALHDQYSIDALGPDDEPAPEAHGVFGLYADGRWFHLGDRDHEPDVFDVVTLQEEILGPILDVDEASRDARLEYLPGPAGLRALVERCDHDGGIAFALHPMTLEQMMTVVDRGETLPPKSTYFEPKVRSGVFLVPR